MNRQSSVHGRVDLFEEPQHVATGVAFAEVGDDLPGRDVHRCEQIDGAVAFVVIAGQQGMVGWNPTAPARRG